MEKFERLTQAIEGYKADKEIKIQEKMSLIAEEVKRKDAEFDEEQSELLNNEQSRHAMAEQNENEIHQKKVDSIIQTIEAKKKAYLNVLMLEAEKTVEEEYGFEKIINSLNKIMEN